MNYMQFIDIEGFCEDIDEGKYPLLLIHSLQKVDSLIQSILQQQKISRRLTMKMKQIIFQRLKINGSLDCKLSVIKELYSLIKGVVKALERETKTKNGSCGGCCTS